MRKSKITFCCSDWSHLLRHNLILINQISVWSRMLFQEVTANYGFMEKYLATEAGIQMMLTVGQAVSGIQDKGEFHR